MREDYAGRLCGRVVLFILTFKEGWRIGGKAQPYLKQLYGMKVGRARRWVLFTY